MNSLNKKKEKIQEIEDLKKNERNQYLNIFFELIVSIIIYITAIVIL